MRLSWSEIRARAHAFVEEWAGETYERGEAQSFYNEFFYIFGMRRRQVASFEHAVKKLDNRQGFIDLFWPSVLVAEHKSTGRDLTKAQGQALDYFPGLKSYELPRYILACDFQSFELTDLDARETYVFRLEDLPDNIERFKFVLGQEVTFREQDEANMYAAGLMARLHDALHAANYRGHDLERFLVRLLFCLFADDTGIFEPRGMFETLIKERTQDDGSDTGRMLAQVFEILDIDTPDRPHIAEEELRDLPYVNGGLFAERLRTAPFDRSSRDLLIEASEFKWNAVSPAIFGWLFQWVMGADDQRKQGAHYTSEKNILKVIRGLFLDDLRAEFDRLTARRTGRAAGLRAFHDRLARLTFLDPACGCGNFLVITYRELRRLETEVLVELFKRAGMAGAETDFRDFNVAALSRINVDAFYGIELAEFPVRVAEVAMWMADHIENRRLSDEFGKAFARIPLRASPVIRHADALEIDWAEVLPPERCDYVIGNPPFVGSKYQSSVQRQQVRRIARLGGSGGTLDYVAAWFLKAGDYLGRAERRPATIDVATTDFTLVGAGTELARPPRAPRIGFVATNSITQGEQVAQMWPLLFDRYELEIAFAHRTFAWGYDGAAADRRLLRKAGLPKEFTTSAAVHVVIVGLTRREDEPRTKRLFSYPDIKGDPVETTHAALTPYLFDAGTVTNRHLVVEEVGRPINGARRMISGSQPIDDGNYIFDPAQRAAFLADEPAAERWMRPYVGTQEYLYGIPRWILALQDAAPEVLRQLPLTVHRMRAVRAFRAKSKRPQTLAIAPFPARYNVEVLPARPFLVVPEVSSERRDYVPIGWLAPPVIPSNLIRIIPDATLTDFAILTSRMHMAWLRHIGGRLKSDYRYSLGLIYNTFPRPALASARSESRLQALAQAVLDARSAHSGSTLADLYDPDVMPADLRRAHQALDQAVDRLYRSQPFADDRLRVEHLFGLYERMVAPVEVVTRPAGRRPSRKSSPV